MSGNALLLIETGHHNTDAVTQRICLIIQFDCELPVLTAEGADFFLDWANKLQVVKIIRANRIVFFMHVF